MPTKLSQIIAVEKGVKSDATRRITDLHRDVQKPPLLTGIARTYQPRAEDGEPLPGESTKVQIQATGVLAEAAAVLTRLFDVTATKDWANTAARADVVVDDVPVLTGVPVTYLLFLEKQLTDLHTFVAKLPVLDPAQDWRAPGERGNETEWYASVPTQNVRNRQILRNHVKAEATQQHPAQVEVYTENVPVGDWTVVNFSGALPATRVRELLDRVTALQAAVKYAREEANTTPVTDQHVGEAVFAYLLA